MDQAPSTQVPFSDSEQQQQQQQQQQSNSATAPPNMSDLASQQQTTQQQQPQTQQPQTQQAQLTQQQQLEQLEQLQQQQMAALNQYHTQAGLAVHHHLARHGSSGGQLYGYGYGAQPHAGYGQMFPGQMHMHSGGQLGGQIEIKMGVPSQHAGGVIGKGGYYINMIRQHSGCRVKIASKQESAPGSPERILTLSGTQDQIARAQQMIHAKLAELATSESVQSSSQYAHAIYATQPYDLQGGLMQPSSTIEVGIPNEFIGRVIGRGGSAINEIRMQSGAKIDIKEAEPGNNIRVCSITGSAHAQEMAQFLLSHKMVAHAQQIAHTIGVGGEASSANYMPQAMQQVAPPPQE